MTESGDAIEDATVVWRDGRIVSINDRPAPRAFRRIAGRGKFLLPGFSDMHVHIEHRMRVQSSGAPATFIDALDPSDLLLPYVANGVLQVFNLSAANESLEQAAAVESGRILGPHIAQALLIEGGPPHPSIATANEPAEGRAIVQKAAADGYDAIKVYSRLNLPTFKAILDEALRLNIKVVGHLPLRGQGQTDELLAAGMELVAHAEEFAYQAPTIREEDIPTYVRSMLARGTALVTTARTNERIVERTIAPHLLGRRADLAYVHPVTRFKWQYRNDYAETLERLERRRQVLSFNAALLNALWEAKVPLLVGTDATIAGVVPGSGLHEELESLTRIGLPAGAVLQAATRLPAEWLGTIRDRGTIEVGKRADLVLLDGDPRKDITMTRRIAAVIVNGRVLHRSELERRMALLAKRYAARWAVAQPDLDRQR